MTVPCPLAAEGQIDKVLDTVNIQLAGHRLILRLFSLAEAVQPFRQVVQFVYIDCFGYIRLSVLNRDSHGSVENQKLIIEE